MAEQTVSPDELLAVITEYYLRSHDFNGISARELAEAFGVSWPSLHDPLSTLIRVGNVGVLFVTTHLNPHIIRIGFASQEEQLRELEASDLHHTCVYLRYLANLTPGHQQIWKARELQGNFKLHPDYFRTTINGDWPEGKSVFTAFLAELHIINRVAAAMGRPCLFREDFKEDSERKPRNFAFLIRPTLKEFNDFVHTLDKLISENINREFFKNDVTFEIETNRDDGKTVVQPKGTLQALHEWLTRFGGPETTGAAEIVNVFRRIRQLRQRPAHALDENVFDQKYVKEQRALMVDAYRALQLLRESLSSHPSLGGNKVDVPSWMLEGRVWTM